MISMYKVGLKKFNIYIMLSLAFVCMLLVRTGCTLGDFSPPPELIKEIDKVYDANHEERVDVTSTVEKFIPIGTSKQKVVEYLKKNRFQVFVGSEKSKREEDKNSIYAVYVGHFPFSFTAGEYRILITLEDNKVKTFWADRFLLAP
jgi:hypothetical protein